MFKDFFEEKGAREREDDKCLVWISLKEGETPE
jgi:sigma-B regulation protein RsbU (phosphoserine phosphatase)